MKSYQWWWVIGTLFLIMGIVSALGEWVFHWWEDPGQYLAVIGLMVGVMSYATAATGTDLDRLGTRLASADGQASLQRGQDRLVVAQDRLVEGQDRLVEGQDRLVEGQDRLVQGQREIIAGQREQTALLQRLVDSFRGR